MVETRQQQNYGRQHKQLREKSICETREKEKRDGEMKEIDVFGGLNGTLAMCFHSI